MTAHVHDPYPQAAGEPHADPRRTPEEYSNRDGGREMDVSIDRLEVVDSRYRGAARCAVCGNQVDAGEGVTAIYRGRVLRFKCQGCVTRFERDPERFLGAPEPTCCGREEAESPASEWRCD